VGTTRSGAIANPLEKDQYTFSLAAATRVRLTLAGSSATGFLSKADIYDSTGTWRGSVTAGRTWEGTLGAGNYIIRVYDCNLAYVGSYTVGLFKVA
jgi:hypothetical protein